MNLGEIIRNLRKELGVSQTEFANMIGISRTYLSDLENCRKSPSIDTAKKIASKLNMKLEIKFISKK